MAYPRLPLEQRMEIIDAFVQAGLSPFEIAQVHHIPEGQVVSILREQGIPTGRKHGSTIADRFSSAQLDDIVDEYTNGEDSVTDLCFRWGLTHHQLWRLLDQLQVPRRKYMKSRRAGYNIRLERAVEMYVDGAPLWHIRDETGLASPSIYFELRRRKIPLRSEKVPR